MASNYEEGSVSGNDRSRLNLAPTNQNFDNKYNPHWRREYETQQYPGPGGKSMHRNNRQGWQYGRRYPGGWQKRNRESYRGRGQYNPHSHPGSYAQPNESIISNQVEKNPEAASSSKTVKGAVANGVNPPKVECRHDVKGSRVENWRAKPERNQPNQLHRVRKRNKFAGQNNNIRAQASIPHFEVDTSFSFEMQVFNIIRQVEQTEENKLKVAKVLNDLKYNFGGVLPDVEPQVFGSMLTDLAFTSSDLDAFLYCPSGQPEYNFVQEKGSLIYKGQRFINVVRLGHARVPVIKAHHVETGVNVDITITSRVGVMNSLMLRFLITKGDPRIRQILMLNLLWSKLAKVSGVSRLSSYTICLMTVFYLQQLEPSILPPLHTLVIPVDDLSWPMQFKDDPSLLQTTNSTPLKDIFRGFFKFYSKFDFGNNVISPFSGQIIPCAYFTELDNLPSCYEHYKKMHQTCDKKFLAKSVMHVQEPLDLTANTAHSACKPLPEMINTTCSLVVDFLDSFIETESLYLLFNFAAKPVFKERTAKIKFAVPNVEHDKLVSAVMVVFRHIFLIQLEEVGKGGVKQPRLLNENGSGTLWYTCSAWSNPLCKFRNGVVRALATCKVSKFAKQVISTRYVLSQLKRKYHFQALIHLKYFTDGTVDLNVVDTFDGKANQFHEISECLRVHLRNYVLLALEDNSWESLLSLIDKMFSNLPENINLSNLKEFVESHYSVPDTNDNLTKMNDTQYSKPDTDDSSHKMDDTEYSDPDTNDNPKNDDTLYSVPDTNDDPTKMDDIECSVPDTKDNTTKMNDSSPSDNKPIESSNKFLECIERIARRT